MLTLALRVALAWTLMSLVLTAFWVLLLEVGRRFGSRPALKPPALQERQQSAQVTAIYGDFVDEDGARAESFARREETAESDIIIVVPGTVGESKRWAHPWPWRLLRGRRDVLFVDPYLDRAEFLDRLEQHLAISPDILA
jgi:hypothetical protein